MPHFEDQSEVDAYYLSDPAHPRAAGVMWPAIIERRIDKLYETGLRPDKVVHNELFQPSGALGNYAVKARLAYLLGWIEKDFYNDLIIISKIRNRFAHDLEAKDFDDQKISAWLKNLKVYKLLSPMLEKAKQEAADDPTLRNNLLIDIIEDALGDGRMGFRWCVDMMVHHLDKCAANMARNLANLPGNWLTAAEAAKSPSPDNQNIAT